MGAYSAALYQAMVDDTSSYVDSFDVDDVGWELIACQSLRSSFYKKFVEFKARDADDKAFDLFRANNRRCADWKPTTKLVNSEVFGEFKNSLYNFWNKNGYSLVHCFSDILYRGHFGSGSTRSCGFATTYTKLFASPLTCSSPILYTLYSDITNHNPTWRGAEFERQRLCGSVRYVDSNRLSFVPKTESISRVICTEPTLNNFLQLGFGQILLDRLKEVFNIDLSIQPDHNREMARIGSITGLFGTIDLKSASDTISLNLLEAVLPRQFLNWLKLLRSSRVEHGEGSDELHMVSSMGNGFTFPLQTVIFACAVSAIYKVLNIKLRRPGKQFPGNFGVFGDDIIVVPEAYDALITFLNDIGFIVNADKSFNRGLFRESCGHDYYHGQFVRGVYLKRLETKQDFFVAINRLNDWTSMTGIPLKRTLALLRSRLKADYSVPLFENDDAGVKVPDRLVVNRLFDRATGSRRYRRFLSRPGSLRIIDGRIIAPRRADVAYNLFGLALCHLEGSVRKHKILIRLNHTSYATKWTITPFWDYSPPVHPFYGWFRTVSLSQACIVNTLK